MSQIPPPAPYEPSEWAKDDPRRIFVEGAKWWEFESDSATMWQADVRRAEEEAQRRYPVSETRTTERRTAQVAYPGIDRREQIEQREACAGEGNGDSAKANGPEVDPPASHPTPAAEGIVCHAPGERCHACPHYYGKAAVCKYAPEPAHEGSLPNLRDCKHGRLARSCEICDLEREVADLKHDIERAVAENTRLINERPVSAILPISDDEDWGMGPDGDIDVCKYITQTPALMSMLYDLNLMPEQHPDREGPGWERIFIIANHWRQNALAAEPPRAEAVEPVAWVIQSMNDGSYMDKIAVAGWLMFDKHMEKLKEDAWVRAGVAKIVPLYAAPPSPPPSAGAKPALALSSQLKADISTRLRSDRWKAFSHYEHDLILKALDYCRSDPPPSPPSAWAVGRHWTEDFPHENGQYQCRCVDCGQMFIGHKRRVVCKACAAPIAPAPEETPK